MFERDFHYVGIVVVDQGFRFCFLDQFIHQMIFCRWAALVAQRQSACLMSTYSRGRGFKSSQVLGFPLFLSLISVRRYNDTDFLTTISMLSMDVLALGNIDAQHGCSRLRQNKLKTTHTDLTKTTTHLYHRLTIVRKAITRHFKMA